MTIGWLMGYTDVRAIVLDEMIKSELLIFAPSTLP